MAPIPSVIPVKLYKEIGSQRRPVTFTEVDSPGPNVITLHLARHGQGYHNAAKEEWLENGQQGLMVSHGIPPASRTPSHPLCVSPQPFSFENRENVPHLMDAELTEQGLGEAVALRKVVAKISPTLCVVSPMRRPPRGCIDIPSFAYSLHDASLGLL